MSGHGLSAGEVARRLGVAITTLRSWHRRYGLGPGLHTPGRHRRYTEADLARLQEMVRLTAYGTPAAEAARIVLAPRPQAPRAARAGGGHTIPVGRADDAARGLARAAMRLDAEAMVGLIRAAVRERGVADTWRRMICPVLTGVGERHVATGRLVEVEHLLARSVSEALASVSRPGDAPCRVLLACADDEQHSLPIEALAAALAEAGHPCRLLGARVPPQALLAAVRRTGPAAVLVWAHRPETGDPAQLRSLLARRPRPVVVAAAGPGWPPDTPPAVHRPATLDGALELLVPLAGPRHRL